MHIQPHGTQKLFRASVTCSRTLWNVEYRGGIEATNHWCDHLNHGCSQAMISKELPQSSCQSWPLTKPGKMVFLETRRRTQEHRESASGRENIPEGQLQLHLHQSGIVPSKPWGSLGCFSRVKQLNTSVNAVLQVSVIFESVKGLFYYYFSKRLEFNIKCKKV